MSFVVVPGVFAPLLATFTYRRAGLAWLPAFGWAALGALLALAGAAVTSLVYGLGVDVEAGLCGSTPAAAVVAGALAYLVIGSWAATRPRRVWAWAFAVASGAAAYVIVSYFFAGAHAYCET